MNLEPSSAPSPPEEEVEETIEIEDEPIDILEDSALPSLSSEKPVKTGCSTMNDEPKLLAILFAGLFILCFIMKRK